MTEKWRDIPGFPGYAISESGDVLSRTRSAPGSYVLGVPHTRTVQARILKPNRWGRLTLRGKVVRVADLLARTWGEEAQCEN